MTSNTTNNCGCSGTWRIGFQYPRYNSPIYYIDRPGAEFDVLSQVTIQTTGNDDVCVKFSCTGNLVGLDSTESSVRFTGATFTKDDPNCVSVRPEKHDCINGVCEKASKYNTPGYFASLEKCQQLCAFSCSDGKICVDPNSFCPQDHVCLESAEYRQITSLISKISQEIC